MRINAALAALFLAVAPVIAAETADTGEALVDRLIRSPGEFDQMCDAPPPLDPKVPLPIYALVADRDIHLSKENLAELRKHRAEVVPVLQKRLAVFDFTKPPKPVSNKRVFKDDSVEVSGINPRQLSGLLYEMILGLDAVEVLPDLLRLEEQLRSLLEKADQDKKNAVPPVELDGYVTMPSGSKTLTKRDQAMSRARVVQRELLSVMLQLLRNQKYQPLLDSEMEKTYAKAIKQRAQEDDLKDIKTPEDAKAKGDDWVQFDVIYGVPLAYLGKQLAVPFSADLRNTIRGYATDFTKSVPPEQWKRSWEK
jgi:hypothetical protein